MPRVNHVKKARKAQPDHGIEIGDSYYWWAFRVGGRGSIKRVSKTRPRQSQLTLSEYYGGVYAIQESMEDMDMKGFNEDVAQELIENIRELGEEQRGKYDNMPEGLQQGSTGELLEQRAESMEEWASELENIEIPDYPEDEKDEEAMETFESAFEEFREVTPDIE